LWIKQPDAELLMSEPSLPELESRRAGLFARLAAIGDFRRGTVTENYRRCGKPNCACAQPGHPGHGPRWLWTRTVAGRGTRGRQLAAGEVEKVRREVDRYQEFAALTEQIVQVSEAICEARPVQPEAGRRGPAAEGLEQLRAQVAAEFAAEVEQLAAAAVRSLAGDSGGAGLEAAEMAIRAAMTTVGASLLTGLLAGDAGYRGPRIPCGAGHLAEFVSYRDKTFGTVLGPVTASRAWYHCRACEQGLAPRDAELGLAGDTMSRGLAKMTARAAAAEPFARGSGLLADLAGVQVSARRMERHAEADGAAAAQVITAQAAAVKAGAVIPLPPAVRPDKMYIAIDGTGVPVVRAETDGRPGKGEDGRSRTREVKLACVFTQTRVDDDGYPIRDPDSSSYLATFAAAAPFGIMMAAEARARGARHVRQLTILGDGAHWIWNLASEHFPEATQIVDLYHAREHLHDLAKMLAFMLGDTSSEWLADRSAELDAGDIDALTAAARVFPLTGIKAADLDKALAYFETNAPRMRYRHFRSHGLFIGSGVVEAGCKSVIGQRLKLSGMHWSVAGAAAILTLRCQQASGRWEEIWQQPNNQTQPPHLASKAS
jgi:hypothetical protein